MKVFIVLCLVLASVVADESERQSSYSNSNNNNRNYDDSNESDAPSMSSRRNSNSRRTSQVMNGLTPEALQALFQAQARQGQQQQQQQNTAEDSSLGYWASYPDAASFDAKIKARLGSSQTLAAKPEVRRKIAEIAEEKFNQCKNLTGDRERACLGRITGQVMQLVGAVETMARNPQQ